MRGGSERVGGFHSQKKRATAAGKRGEGGLTSRNPAHQLKLEKGKQQKRERKRVGNSDSSPRT